MHRALVRKVYRPEAELSLGSKFRVIARIWPPPPISRNLISPMWLKTFTDPVPRPAGHSSRLACEAMVRSMEKSSDHDAWIGSNVDDLIGPMPQRDASLPAAACNDIP
jgi:hypothetical protein